MIEHSDGTFQDRYKKYFQDLQDRTESYKMLNYSLQQKAKNAFGENIFSNPELPADFDLNSLDGKFFEERQYIDYSMPYSDRMFQEFIDMKKTPVNSLFTYNTDNGKIVSGAYLIENPSTISLCFLLCRSLGIARTKTTLQSTYKSHLKARHGLTLSDLTIMTASTLIISSTTN